MKQVTKKIKALGLVAPAFALAVALLPVNLVGAQDFSGGISGGADASKGSDQPNTLFGDGGIFSTIVNTILFLIGALSIIMLVVGGIRYTISGGNQDQIKAAKNTIMYAIIGIVVALLAYAIVNFVLTTLIS